MRYLIVSKRRLTCLAQAPLAGRERNDPGANLRSFPVEGHIVFYTPVSDGIEVMRVMSGWRDIREETHASQSRISASAAGAACT
jgi:toxin ParE1/3/4